MRSYLVGGAVRDRLLGRPEGDRDWVVVGSTPQEMIRAGFLPVGKDFPVFLHPQTKEEYALARTERKTAPGYHGFTFHADPGVSLEQDLARRDFTINAIAQAEDGSLVDPYGGVRDIEARVLRHVSPAFAEDPVRILRAARFMARFAPLGFRVAEETLQLMRDMVASGEVDHLVAERVWQELRKALEEAQPSAAIRVLRDCGALAPLRAVCARLKVPAEYAAVAEIACREHLNVHRLDELRPDTVHDLVARADGFRKPERIRQLALVCEADSRGRLGRQENDYPQGRRLLALHEAMLAVTAGQAVAKGLSGPDVGEWLRKARAEAVTKLRQQWSEGAAP